jgi:hypothetical protein
VTATIAAKPTKPARPHGRPASRLPGVVLGDLQVVAADRLDRAVHAGPIAQVDPDRVTAAGQLTQGQGQLVWADDRPGVRRSGGGSAGRTTETAEPCTGRIGLLFLRRPSLDRLADSPTEGAEAER